MHPYLWPPVAIVFFHRTANVLSVVLLLKSKPSTLYHGWFGQKKSCKWKPGTGTTHAHSRDIWAMFTMVRYLMKHLDVFLMDLYIWSFLTWKRQCEFEHMYTFRYGGTQNNETNLEGLKRGWVCVSAPTHTEAHTRERSRAWNVPVWKMNE